MAILDRQEIRRAAALIRKGGLVAMPTETVYGLAADATNDRAVARVFEAKGRPRFNPLIVHVADLEMAQALAEFPPLAETLARAFWPGPLTLVLPRRSHASLSLLTSAGLDTVALRAPNHPVAQALIDETGLPLAAPSANISGTVSPTRPEHVRESLGDTVDMIVDAGPCPIGVESTIVKVEGEKAYLLRTGGLARADIERVLGAPLETPPSSGKVEAPGTLESHYAPHAPLRINVDAPSPDEAFLSFGPAPKDHPHTFRLSQSDDLREAAANLFAHLRAADRVCRTARLKGIAVAPIPAEGLGEAINDRLRRAAHR